MIVEIKENTNTIVVHIAEVGERGATGPTGPIGPQGPVGLQGEIGPQGIQGVQGLKGDKGDQGIQGIQGEPAPDFIPGNYNLGEFTNPTTNPFIRESSLPLIPESKIIYYNHNPIIYNGIWDVNVNVFSIPILANTIKNGDLWEVKMLHNPEAYAFAGFTFNNELSTLGMKESNGNAGNIITRHIFFKNNKYYSIIVGGINESVPNLGLSENNFFISQANTFDVFMRNYNYGVNYINKIFWILITKLN